MYIGKESIDELVKKAQEFYDVRVEYRGAPKQSMCGEEYYKVFMNGKILEYTKYTTDFESNALFGFLRGLLFDRIVIEESDDPEDSKDRVTITPDTIYVTRVYSDEILLKIENHSNEKRAYRMSFCIPESLQIKQTFDVTSHHIDDERLMFEWEVEVKAHQQRLFFLLLKDNKGERGRKKSRISVKRLLDNKEIFVKDITLFLH